ncbi:hypothetical protein [Niveibacterium umoris]|uniref:Uncharacterized protein n=1 Tax=Niveibacterium umoris TaxID=1193620 RepID=A0A840BQE0_9RHOO|nr:hypothetical protein [Niveibacterium umoris]MBB4013689.1 hypothetical protein [Niveibacterium umoris]
MIHGFHLGQAAKKTDIHSGHPAPDLGQRNHRVGNWGLARRRLHGSEANGGLGSLACPELVMAKADMGRIITASELRPDGRLLCGCERLKVS